MQSTQTMPVTYKVRPSADVSEDGQAYYLDINLPGVDESTLEVDVCGNELQISAAMRLPQCPGQVMAMEFVPMAYGIRFAISPLVDALKLSARLERGVLSLVVPKRTADKA